MKPKYLYRGWKSTVLPALFYTVGLIVIGLAVWGIISYLEGI